jgi:hypothetical protein
MNYRDINNAQSVYRSVNAEFKVDRFGRYSIFTDKKFTFPQINRKNAIHVSSKKAYRNKSALPWDRADQQSTFPKPALISGG